MRLLRCVWQTWRHILPASRQTEPLKIQTVHGFSIETVPRMKEIHKTGFSYQKLPSKNSDYIEFYDKNGEMVATYFNNGWTMYTFDAKA